VGGASRVGVDEAQRVLDGRAPGRVVDVREASETASVSVAGALNLPLSALKSRASELDGGAPVLLLCRSGARAASAAETLASLGFSDARVIEGGLEAWIAAGKPVVRGSGRVWSMERQVRFAAGALVLLGLALARLVRPGFAVLSALVGAGLVFSAVTDTCGMAALLGRLPWNRARPPR
jgi:rhodanese-related sulfurtransferase